LYAVTRAGAWDTVGREGLLRYVLRPPIAQERLEQRPDGLVRITLKKAYSDGTVAVDMDPLPLLCRLATSVPPPRFHTVRYAGVPAGASPWRPRLAPKPPTPEPAAASGEPDRTRPAGGYRPWAELLARTFAVDVLACHQRRGHPQGRRVYVKDAFHRQIVDGEAATNPEGRGTKAAFHHVRLVPAGRSAVLRLRLTPEPPEAPLTTVDAIVAQRRHEADVFYAGVQPKGASDDEKAVQRQAFAGMLWSKQNYLFDVELWLRGDDPKPPPPASRLKIRNVHWGHLNSMRVLSMPDKWEYPWFAAWDLAFHTLPLALVDAEFAKEQLFLMLFGQFQHPNGQIPAYEWEFSDLNPPVQAWAVWRVYNMDRIRSGRADRLFLERCYRKLLINFAWWVNKVDSQGNCVFEGGFLGLDNITLFDRSERLPGGAVLEQSDGTGWMGMFCLNMMRIALELARENPAYEILATKFFQHYVYVGAAMKRMGGRDHDLWDEQDGFFYDVLRYPDGRFEKLRVRSMVGLVPLFAVERLESAWTGQFKEFTSNVRWFMDNRPELVRHCVNRIVRDGQETLALTIVDQGQLKRMLRRLVDPDEFLSAYGLRSPVEVPRDEPVRARQRPRRLRARGGRVQDQGRQLQLARPDLVPDGVPDGRGAAEAREGLRLRSDLRGQGRPHVDDRRGRAHPGRAPRLDLPPRRLRPAPRLRRPRALPVGPALARPRAVPRVLPRRRRLRPRRFPPDRLDGPRGLADRRVEEVAAAGAVAGAE
jgi:hypothetical protein